MPFGPITSWQINGKKKKKKRKKILFSWAPKSLLTVTEAMKLRHLLLGRKAMTNLDSTVKSRDITLPKKVRLVKAMVFPVCMDKLNIQKTKIMASGPITSWQIDGETVETVTDFIFLGSKITADGDCSREIKTLAPWKKSYDQSRQHSKKQRHNFEIGRASCRERV